MDRVDNIKIQEIISKIKAENPSITNEQIISILNNSLDGVKLTNEQLVSIMHSNNLLEEPSLENKSEQRLEQLRERINKAKEGISKAEKNNGAVGNLWSLIKNTTGIGDSSNDIRAAHKAELDSLAKGDLKTAFLEITGVEYNEENFNKFLNGEIKTKSETALEEYKIGQEDSADFAGDMVSGIASMGLYTFAIAAVTTMGAPIAAAAGIALAGAAVIGAGIKVATKALDASAGDKTYDTLGKDIVTGAVNGVIAPVASCFGGRIAASAVSKIGGQAIKEGTEVVAREALEETTENFFKSAMLNPMGNIYEGNLAQKATGYVVELGFDGGVSGGADAAARAAYEGKSLEEVGDAAIQGTVFGAVGGIALGGAMKAAGNYLHSKGVDVGNNIKRGGSSGNLPMKINSLTDVFHKAETTNTEAIEILKKYGITEKEYLYIPQHPMLNEVIRVGDFFQDLNVEGCFKGKTKEEILYLLVSIEEFTDEIKYCQFMNKENLKVIEQLEGCPPDKALEKMCDIFNTLKSEKYFCRYYEIARELDYPLSGLMYYLDSPFTTTVQELKIKKRLDELEDGIFYPTDNFEISDLSKINEQFFEEYAAVTRELKENGVYMGQCSDPIEKLEEAKQILAAIKEFDIDFKKTDISTNIISRIFKKHSSEQVLEFYGALSADSKTLYKDTIIRFLDYEKYTDIELKEFAEVFNILAEIKTLREKGKDSFECSNILDFPNETIREAFKSGLDLKDLTTFLKSCQDIDWTPTHVSIFRQLKPDVDLSVQILKEVKTLCDSEYGKNLKFENFAYHSFNGNDYSAECVSNIRKIIESKIHIYDTSLLKTFIQCPHSVDNYVLLQKNGIELDNTSTTINILTKHPTEKLDECIKKLKGMIIEDEDIKEVKAINQETLFFLTNQNYNQAQYILNSLLNNELVDERTIAYYKHGNALLLRQLVEIDGVGDFCTRLINDTELEFPTKYLSRIVSSIYSKETFDIIEELCTNKIYSKYWDSFLPELCDKITPQNKDFFVELIKQPEFEKGFVFNIMRRCGNSQRASLASALCFDKDVTFPLEKVSGLLSNWSCECEEVLLSVCKENPLGFSPDEILILATHLYKEKLPVFEKLCKRADDFTTKGIVSIVSNLKSRYSMDFMERVLKDNALNGKEHLPSIIEKINKGNSDLATYLYFDTNRNFPKEHIASILSKTGNNIDLANKLCNDKNFPVEYIAGIIETIGVQVCPDFVERLCFDKIIDFPKDKIQGLSRLLDKTNNLDVAIKLCTDKHLNFDADDIIKITHYSTAATQDIIAKLCDNHDIPRKVVAATTEHLKKENIPLVEQILSMKGLNVEILPKILECTKCKDGINAGHIDEKKVKGFINLLQNPSTSEFCVKLLNDDFDMDTVAFLSKTKKKLNAEATNKPKTENKVIADFNTSQIDSYEVFTSRGLSEKEASAIIKAISIDGNINHNMQVKALSLIEQGVAKNKIGDILSQAKISGEYNPKIVDDFVLLQNRGLNPLLEKNLAVINNISGHDTFFKFNPKVRKQMLGMISGMNEAQKAELLKLGIDIDSIVKKLEIKIENSNLGKVKVKSGLRSKASLEGFEKVIVNKYNPAENIWRNPEACKTWANDKYLEFRNHDYSSRLYPNANADRTRIFNDWFEFLDNDETIKENPFAKIIIIEFITNNVEPENAWLPPEFDKEIAKDLLRTALDDSQNISFSKAYTEKLRAKAELGTEKEEVFVDGFKGTWYTVPQTDKTSPNFKANVEKVKTFSDGTNWCIRTFNAEPYTQQGAMHFFVDENGLTQVCIRENGHKSVAEIQKRQQDSFRPIPYINVIQDFIERKGLYTQRGYLDDAKAAKPKYDKIRSELKILCEQNNYKAILEIMGIKVNVRADGTWELSHYSPDIDQFKIAEFNIREDLLLQNVSRIKGDANFNNSNVTALPKLEEVAGKFVFDESQISDVRSLKVINGKKVVWE